MFFLWYLFYLLFIIHLSTSDQLCIDKCQFEYDIHSDFNLSSDCNVTRRDRCYVLTVFDYVKEKIQVYFSLEPDETSLDDHNQTDLVVRTNLNLEEPSFIKHSVEYFCSTDDQCDLEFVRTIAMPTFVSKSCDKFRSQLIQYLNPNPSSRDRNCFQNEETILKCDRPCELVYTSPNETSRSCSGKLELKFETTVGQSTPIDKPEYEYRTWSFACTTSLCNGESMQQRIENLINSDRGECLVSFTQMNGTTTPIPSKSAWIYSQSLALFIFIVYFLL